MASGIVKKVNKPFAVDTGISGVTAIKSGNMVTLKFIVSLSDTTAGWKTLGVLPTSLLPIGDVLFCCFNNNASRFSDNTIIDVRVAQNGTISAYLFPDALNVAFRGTVTYPTSN